MKPAVSSISPSEAIEGPRIWNTVKVSCAFFAASRKPMSRSDCSVVESRPARMSITVTCASVLDSVSKIFIWSAVECMSTTSVSVGVEALQRALGAFGVEGAGRDVVGDEIVEQRARDGRLADAALVRTHQNHCRLRHTPPSAPESARYRPCASRNHGRTAESMQIAEPPGWGYFPATQRRCELRRVSSARRAPGAGRCGSGGVGRRA